MRKSYILTRIPGNESGVDYFRGDEMFFFLIFQRFVS